MYTYYTAALGFKPNNDEYKLMGLAPYGRPIYKELILNQVNYDKHNLDHILPDYMYKYGCIDLSSAFGNINDFLANSSTLSDNLDHQFQLIADCAASIQSALETHIKDLILENINYFNELGTNNLVIGGGVALNCTMCSMISKQFKLNVYSPPSPGDAGSAIGAILSHQARNKSTHSYLLTNSNDYKDLLFTGTNITYNDIRNACNKIYLEMLDDSDLIKTLDAISNKKIGAIVYGRSEFGPRALCRRSIICRHDDPLMKSKINALVKHREAFRPFAAVFTPSQADKHFYLNRHINNDLLNLSHYQMTTTATTKGFFTKENSAVIHEDNTCRLQIAIPGHNHLIDRLLNKLHSIYNIEGLLNTSLNVNGKPNAETASDIIFTYDAASLDFILFGDEVTGKFYYIS
jgi:carbamoyltransferase